jgi:hypothetical protein
LSDIAEVEEEEELSDPDKDRDKTPVVTPVHMSKKVIPAPSDLLTSLTRPITVFLKLSMKNPYF